MYKKLIGYLKNGKAAAAVISSILGLLIGITIIACIIVSGKKLSGLSAAIAVLFAVVPAAFSAVSLFRFRSKLGKMLEDIGIGSEDEAEAVIKKSEVISDSELPLIFMNKDTVLDFKSLSSFYIKDITEIKKEQLSGAREDSEDSPAKGRKPCIIRIKLGNREHCLAFGSKKACDRIFSKLLKAYSRYGDPNKIYKSDSSS